MTHVLLPFLLHSLGAGIQGQDAGWAPYRRICPALQVDTLPPLFSHLCMLDRLWSLLPRVLIQARALSRGISSYLVCIFTLGDPTPTRTKHKEPDVSG